MRILNTIKPVTRAFTVMDAVRLVAINVLPHAGAKVASPSVVVMYTVSQITRNDALKNLRIK